VPTLKQLYIPTSETARFKAQAWIDALESKLSKWTGSLFNMLLCPLQVAFGAVAGMKYYLLFAGVIGLPLIVVLAITAVYLGKAYKKAIDENKIIC
jgi:AAA family ATP:ADP antiporter